MIRLVQFPPAFGQPNPSPFCVKVELLLKMSGLVYENLYLANPGKGPKGKLPAIEDEGRRIGDSELIRKYLERRYGIDFDPGLSAEQRAIAHAFARLCEERLYWIIVHTRWMEPEHWAVLKRTFFAPLPAPLRPLIAAYLHRGMRKTLHQQGLGRHTREEIYAFGVEDVAALAIELAEKSFFMGEEPTAIDATVYSFLAAIAEAPFDSPVKEACLKRANLMAYCARVGERFFPDFMGRGT